MRTNLHGICKLFVFGLWVMVSGCSGEQMREGSATDTEPAPEVPYTYRVPSNHGIGKIYMGREISRPFYVGEAAWLERPERTAQEFPNRVLEALALTSDVYVADIGAGTGFFTFRLAELVPEGRVYAVDIQQEMLDLLAARRDSLGYTNVIPVLGSEQSPQLPASALDVVLVVDSYHEFAYPYEMMRAILESLKPGGRLALVVYRGEDATIPLDPLRKISLAQVRREMEEVGFRWVRSLDVLPVQHLILLERPRD